MLLLLLSCAHPPALPAPGAGTHVYDVAVVTAAGGRRVSSQYTLEAARQDDDTWLLRTLDAAGTATIGDEQVSFDSTAPGPADPWPLVLQHTVASVPVLVRFDDRGRPAGIVDGERWAAEVRQALDALDLPEEGRRTGAWLVDPDGLLEDLQRTFPGLPDAEPWERGVLIDGVAATRRESCTSEGKVLHCQGRIYGPAQGPMRLHEGTSDTRIEVDRHGLRVHQETYSGTLVVVDGAGTMVQDRPVAARRLVRRR